MVLPVFWCCVRCYDHIYNHIDVVVAGVVATMVQFGLFMADGIATVADGEATLFMTDVICHSGMEITILYNSWCFTVAD